MRRWRPRGLLLLLRGRCPIIMEDAMTASKSRVAASSIQRPPKALRKEAAAEDCFV